MGLFGGKTTTYRDFSTTRVIDDDYLPNVIGQAITKYILDKDNTESLTDLMLQYGWKSNAVKWNAAYRYAAKAGKYAYGLPVTGLVTETSFTGSESLEQVLTTLTGGKDISYVYSKFGNINFRHSMWQLLVSNYNYNTLTNELVTLSNQVGATVYLQNATNYIRGTVQTGADPSQLEHWGYFPQWGPTPLRTADYTSADTADQTSTIGANYSDIQYIFKVTGVVTTTKAVTTKVTTAVTPPGGSTTSTSKSSTSTSSSTNNNGVNVPASLVSTTKSNETSSSSTDTGTPSSTTSTASDGTVTVVTTQVTTVTTTDTYDAVYVAEFNMPFGIYDFNLDASDIDTTTVLDDDDSGIYDPNAALDPSGESTQDDTSWFQVLFNWNDGSANHLSYFTYAYGSGNYPALDGISDTSVSDFGKHFPRIYFRLNGNKLIDDKYANTDAYKTSIKLSKKLDMDWLGLGDEVYNSLSSVDKVRDVCLFQAIPAITTSVLEMEYLFKYFNTYYNLRQATVDDPNYIAVPTAPQGSSRVRPVTDYDTWNAHDGASQISTDTATSMVSACDAIGYRLITGSIGAQGTYATSTGTGTSIVKYGIGSTEDNGTHKVTIYYATKSVAYISYRYQVTDTQYQEIRVFDLTFGAKVGGKFIYKSGTDENLLVPLDYAFRKEFSPHEGETLYARATHMFIGTEYSIKSKWYQTGLFKAVVIVIAVVLSWWTGGASLSLVGVVTAAASAIGAFIIMSLLSKYVFSKLGGWFAILAVIVAVIAIAYGGYLYLTNTVGPYSITAVQMLAASNVAFQAAQSNVNAQIQRYQAQLTALADEQEAAQQKLSDAQELLENNNTITNGIFSSVSAGYIVLGESPLQTYSRTLDTNVGKYALNLASMYLQAGTSLPSSIEIIQQMMSNMYQASELDLGFIPTGVL